MFHTLQNEFTFQHMRHLYITYLITPRKVSSYHGNPMRELGGKLQVTS